MSCRNVSKLRYAYSLKVAKRMVFVPRSGVSMEKRRKQKLSRKKNIKQDDKIFTLADLDPASVMRIENPVELERKVKQLQKFTKKLKDDLLRNKLDADQHTSDIENHADEVFNNIQRSNLVKNSNSGKLISNSRNKNENENEKENLSSLLISLSSKQASKLLPESINKLISDDKLVIQSLSNKSHQNWNPIVQKLYLNKDLLNEITVKNMTKFLGSGISNLTFENVIKLDEILLKYVNEDTTKFKPLMYDCLFRNLSKLTPRTLKITELDNDIIFKKLKELLKRVSDLPDNLVTPRFQNIILNYCLHYSMKLKSIPHIDYFLKYFKENYNLLPDRRNYSNIIRLYYNLKLPEKAWDTFDTMKFLSTSHAPDVVTYNFMLKICGMTNDFAKAIDLFHEMKDKDLIPTVETFTIMGQLLAKCSSNNVTAEGKDEALRLLGWKFISDMSNRDNIYSIGAMMALAAYDGDIAVARALYFDHVMNTYRKLRPTILEEKELWKRSLNPILFNYLLLAYSKFSKERIPLLAAWEQGNILRTQLLNGVDYTMRSNADCSLILPMIPLINLNEKEHIVLESNALWHFHLNYGSAQNDYLKTDQFLFENLMNEIKSESHSMDAFKFSLLSLVHKAKTNQVNVEILNYKCLITYLTIPIRLNDKEEFIRRLEMYTFQEDTLDTLVERLFFNKIATTVNKDCTDQESTAELSVVNSKKYLDDLESLKHKLIMNCSIYEICMKAAIKFEDVELATNTWESRGKFRKTKSFGNLPMPERIERDTIFAQLMVEFFTKVRQYNDALKIVMTSQRFINWKYSMVKSLHQGLAELEDERSIKRLLEIVNKKNPIEKLDLQIQELSL